MATSIKILDTSDIDSKILRFHLLKNVLHYFFKAKNNKAFFLYLIFLELSNNTGFCFFKITDTLYEKLNLKNRKTIYSYIQELNNNYLINAFYDRSKHHWNIQINTTRHIELFKKYQERTGCTLTFENIENLKDDFINEIENLSIHNNPIQDTEEAETDNESKEIEEFEKEIEAIMHEQDEKSKEEDMIAISVEEKQINDFNKTDKIIDTLIGEARRAKDKKVLIVSPYRTDTQIDENVIYSIDVLEWLEKTAREHIVDFGSPKEIISPIQSALKKAKDEIKTNQISDTLKIFEIKQKYLNSINFLDENLINSVDIISITTLNLHNFKELHEIDKLAKKLNKEISYKLVPLPNFTLDEFEMAMKLDMLKKDIDEPNFHLVKKFFDEPLKRLPQTPISMILGGNAPNTNVEALA